MPNSKSSKLWLSRGWDELRLNWNWLGYTGLLNNQGEKSINFYFIMVPFKEKVLKYGTPKPSTGFF